MKKLKTSYKNTQNFKSPPFLKILGTLLELIFFNKKYHPNKLLPTKEVDWEKYRQEKDCFIWLGHSTFLLKLDGVSILNDPVFGDHASNHKWLFPRFQPSVINGTKLPKTNIVLLSHNHYDHLDEPTIRDISLKVDTFVTPVGNAKYLIELGVPGYKIKELRWNESVTVDSLKITCTPAKHHSGRGLFDKNKALWCSWVVESSQKNVFISGDTGYGTHFKEIGDKFKKFDWAFLESGQYNTLWEDHHMFPAQTAQAAIDLNAEATVPIHWGVFALSTHSWNESVVKGSELFETANKKYWTPLMGEIVTEKSEFTKWWS